MNSQQFKWEVIAIRYDNKKQIDIVYAKDLANAVQNFVEIHKMFKPESLKEINIILVDQR